MGESFHRYERKLDNLCSTLSKAPISAGNRRAILGFRDRCFSEGLSVPRIEKYAGHLKKLAILLRKDFRSAGKPDIERVVGQIEKADLSEWTKRDYRIALKKFYRWLRQTTRDPPEVAWLRSDVRNHKRKLPDELLTQDDVASLVRACTNARDRALISVLYDTGCRIGELASLRLKHIVPHEHGLRLIVTGKTGTRRLLAVSSAPYLTRWVNAHPCGSDANSYLWISADRRHQRLSYGRINQILRAAADRAGVSKRVNPHSFRHSRATHLANHLTEAQMKDFFGWTQGSDMASVYVHLSGRDVDSAILSANGIVPPEKKRSDATLKPITCPRCSSHNPATNQFCSHCGTVIDERKAREIAIDDMRQSQSDDIMDRLVEDREFREFLRRKIGQLETKKSAGSGNR